MTRTFQRILVLRGGAIGDFILTLPVLAALRQQFPGARLEILGYPFIAGLALSAGLADAVGRLESRELLPFFIHDSDLPGQQAEYFSSFDLILSYLHDPEKWVEGNIRRCSEALFISSPPRPDERKNIHAADFFLEPLREIGIATGDATPRLIVSPAVPARRLAIHPGSGSEKKNWPEARWLQLVERLAKVSDLHLLVVGGEAEGEKLLRIGRHFPSDRVEVAQGIPLPELAHKLSDCSAFLGHDSGITHLAAAVGLPGVVLWGNYSNPKIWRPRSERMEILRAPSDLSNLSMDEVYDVLRQRVLPLA